MAKSKMTRREFMGRSVAGAAATGVALGAPAILSSASPNEQVTVGLIGAGIRGLELMQYMLNVKAKVAIVCDLYDGHFRRAPLVDAKRRRDLGDEVTPSLIRRRQIDVVGDGEHDGSRRGISRLRHLLNHAVVRDAGHGVERQLHRLPNFDAVDVDLRDLHVN